MYNKKLLFWHRREEAFTVAEFGAPYGESTEFFDENQSSMVYYDEKNFGILSRSTTSSKTFILTT